MSSTDRNLARHITTLGDVHRLFQEKQSGAGRAERTALAEGICAATARGAYTGRSRKLTTDDVATARELINTGVPKAEVSRRLAVDRTTLHRALSTP